MKDLIVIKIGGTSIEQLRPEFFEQLRLWHQAGRKILLIHGGGREISALTQKLQLPVKRENGIRITDQATLQLTRMVLLGQTQPKLLVQLLQHNLPAIGLNAADHQLLQGELLDFTKYGYVGRITAINQAFLKPLLQKQLVITAPLALLGNQWLNINADSAAAAIASLLQADELFLLTDVPGVLKAGQVLPTLTVAAAKRLKAAKIITTGMQPKIAAAFQAARCGVNHVNITNQLSATGTQIIQKEDF
ncbi:MAG: acetylglutamate kinase [Liquorilactobacillus nagelii]|jgi:acetylglutamate kinase|uniref:acetylglutamate kinase n=1 Tax=Liquorilactobacillus nagelii TaxID=82688 RepID=UPI00242AB366|nr:acetylglutamate kinase [Liquorilactobacillus nagelii]MCI1633909.1 acetylglutamate kinase [Liquorilactobacillus nagelii]